VEVEEVAVGGFILHSDHDGGVGAGGIALWSKFSDEVGEIVRRGDEENDWNRSVGEMRRILRVVARSIRRREEEKQRNGAERSEAKFPASLRDKFADHK
jgi:hypothetical protein